MAAPKGHPRYGGRTKGTPNKRTETAKQIIAEAGQDPIKKLIALMKSEDENIQIKAAIELAQYVYQKQHQVVDINGKITHELQQQIQSLQELSDAELDQVIEVEVKKLNE